MILLILLACLFAVIVPVYHVRKILSENERKNINQMNVNQRKAYYTALIGALMLGFIVIVSIIILIINGYQVITSGSQGAGYLLAFLIFPLAIAVIIGGANAYLPLMYSMPTVFIQKQRFANILFIITGMIGFLTVSVLGAFLFINVDLLDADKFHPISLLIYSVYIAPLLLLIGGISGLVIRGK